MQGHWNRDTGGCRSAKSDCLGIPYSVLTIRWVPKKKKYDFQTVPLLFNLLCNKTFFTFSSSPVQEEDVGRYSDYVLALFLQERKTSVKIQKPNKIIEESDSSPAFQLQTVILAWPGPL